MNRPMKIAAAVGIMAIAWLSATTTAYAQDAATDVARGAEVYGAMCGRCHTARSPLEYTDRQWVTITNHMRVRANLTGQQMRAVLAFLQATNTDPGWPSPLESGATTGVPTADYSGPVSADPDVIARGNQLASENACLGCHVIGGAGGNVGPSLNGVVRRLGAADVRHKLANPMFNNSTSMMPNFGLTREQIDAITAYLASLER